MGGAEAAVVGQHWETLLLPIRLSKSSNKRGAGRPHPPRGLGRKLCTHRRHGIETPVAGTGTWSIISVRYDDGRGRIG